VYTWPGGNEVVNENSLSGLNQGAYTLTVTDKNGCEKTKHFVVDPPLPLSGNFEQDHGILCTGNSLELDGGEFSSYKWYKDNELISTDRYFTISEAGTYILEITDNKGCSGIDTFYLDVSEHPLDASLLLPDSALVDQEVRVIDVTYPIPDSIEWLFDQPVQNIWSNEWSHHFSVNSVGKANVTLRAWYGGCSSDSTKNVMIYLDESPGEKKSSVLQPLILGFQAYPNPGNGNFNVRVKLSRKESIILTLYQNTAPFLLNKTEHHGLDNYEVPFTLENLNTGIYMLVLRAGQEQQTAKVVVY